MNGAANTAERTFRIRREPRAVDDSKRFGELAVAYCDEEAREATLMAIVELAENVLKYGAPGAGANAGTLGITVGDTKLRLRASNSVQSPDDAKSVVDMVTKITSAGSAKELYAGRLRELFRNPGLERSQLGLLRIAFEGAFRLSCSYSHPTLEIVAERATKARP